MKRTMIGRGVGGVAGAILLVGVLMLPQAIAVTTRFGASSRGATDAVSPCSAHVLFDIVPIALAVDPGDTVQIWFNYTYYDNRSFDIHNPVATHTFNLTTVHNGFTQTNGVPSYTTYGGGGGSSNDRVDVVITDDTINVATIAISWRASITVGGCSASDPKTHSIALS